jgi:hypothetical protein
MYYRRERGNGSLATRNIFPLLRHFGRDCLRAPGDPDYGRVTIAPTSRVAKVTRKGTECRNDCRGITTPAGDRCGRGCSPWLARRPTTSPGVPLPGRFLPVEDFQLSPQYDTVDRALTVLAVDQVLDKLPSIYGNVMRLARDGFTQSEIAGRLGIPIGTVTSRMAKAAGTLRADLASLRGATMLSEGEIELAHPEAFDFVFGNLPRDKRAEFNCHLHGCRYCQGVIDEYADIGRIIKNLPLTSNRPPALRTGPPPPWSSRGPSPIASRMPKTRPLPGSRGPASG